MTRFRDQLSPALDQQAEQIERAELIGAGGGVAVLVDPRQATAIEAEAFEKQNIGLVRSIPRACCSGHFSATLRWHSLDGSFRFL